MRTTKFFSVALALVSLACQSTTEPSQIPIQFQSTFSGAPVQQLTISPEGSSIRVVGGYHGGGCGVGAFAVADGSVLRLTVGPPPSNSAVCDLILVTINYSGLLKVAAGTYSVEVFHRPVPWGSAELAGRAVVTVQ